MWVHPPSWIWPEVNSDNLATSSVPYCNRVLNFSTIKQSVAELLVISRILAARLFGEDLNVEFDQPNETKFGIHVR